MPSDFPAPTFDPRTQIEQTVVESKTISGNPSSPYTGAVMVGILTNFFATAHCVPTPRPSHTLWR